jgi:hypothetical protein
MSGTGHPVHTVACIFFCFLSQAVLFSLSSLSVPLFVYYPCFDFSASLFSLFCFPKHMKI